MAQADIKVLIRERTALHSLLAPLPKFSLESDLCHS
jgi:hypothetical protein